MLLTAYPAATFAAPPASTPQPATAVLMRNGSPLQKGATEWSLISGGGTRIGGSVGEHDFWALHMRWGRVLTAPHGSGFLRGTVEYAFEMVPAMVTGESKTVFGAGFNPLLLQYNFTSTRHLVPFIQAGGGILFTDRELPAGTSRFNFTPQAGLGVYWARWPHSAVSFGVRYHHISNAGTAERNPGHNSLYVYSGISWWH